MRYTCLVKTELFSLANARGAYKEVPLHMYLPLLFWQTGYSVRLVKQYLVGYHILNQRMCGHVTVLNKNIGI